MDSHLHTYPILPYSIPVEVVVGGAGVVSGGWHGNLSEVHTRIKY